MDELIELYHKSTLVDNFRIDRNILKRHNFSESQWDRFLDLAEDLELNEVGVRIILDEIKSGRAVLK